MTLATAGIVFGSYQRWGLGVPSGRPSTCWATMTLRCGVGRRRLDLVHEGVVADAVLDDESGARHLLGHAGARLEGVRVGVGVVEDGGHLDVLAPDLAEHVGVLVLGADGSDDPATGWSGSPGEEQPASPNAQMVRVTVMAARPPELRLQRLPLW